MFEEEARRLPEMARNLMTLRYALTFPLRSTGLKAQRRAQRSGASPLKLGVERRHGISAFGRWSFKYGICPSDLTIAVDSS